MKLQLESIAVLAALGAAAIAALYIAKKGVAGAAAGAVGAAADAAAGAVVGIGGIVGIPATSESACEQARREGRTWDASFACPAGDFFDYLFTGPDPALPSTGDFARMDRQAPAAPPAPSYETPGLYDFGGSFGYGSA